MERMKIYLEYGYCWIAKAMGREGEERRRRRMG
jgi:hypothetical protein